MTDPRLTLQLDANRRYVVCDQDGKTELVRTFMREKRLAAGLSIYALQHMTGVAHQSLSQFERGEVKTLIALPDVLDALGLELRIVSKQD